MARKTLLDNTLLLRFSVALLLSMLLSISIISMCCLLFKKTQMCFLVFLFWFATAVEAPRRGRLHLIFLSAKQRRHAKSAHHSAASQILRIGRQRMASIKGKYWGTPCSLAWIFSSSSSQSPPPFNLRSRSFNSTGFYSFPPHWLKDINETKKNFHLFIHGGQLWRPSLPNKKIIIKNNI